MAEVELDGVTKIFPGDAVALERFDLRVEDGELVVIVGPSGCGKSTALRILAGLESPTEGRVLLGGEDVTDRTPQERNVSMVFQSYALYPHKTVRENMDFPLRMMGMAADERRERIEETARILGLEGQLDRKPGELSGGQSQRAAMGRALVRAPLVSLMDEPLSNLDAKLRVEIRAQIAELQRELALTTIYVTHDQVEAMTLGDRVAVLRRGRLQQYAPPQQVYDRPANVFVATFIGSPRMNVVRAELGRDAEGWVLGLGGLEAPFRPRRHADREAIDAAVGGSVLAGFRPEAFRLPGEEEEGFRIEGTVETAEALGHERIVYVRPSLELELVEEAGEGRTEEGRRSEREDRGPRDGVLVARLPAGEPLEPGAAIELALDVDQVHLFDPEGKRL